MLVISFIMSVVSHQLLFSLLVNLRKTFFEDFHQILVS